MYREKRGEKYFDILIWLARWPVCTVHYRQGNLNDTITTRFPFPIRNINMGLNLAIGMNINDLWF